MKIDIIGGARPNFIKISPVIDAIKTISPKNFEYRLIHTGQHYDNNMSGNFFKELRIPNPHYNLNAHDSDPTIQTTKIMIGYQNLLYKDTPDICMVFGDVNSTMACAIVAKKMNIKIAHIEAGIRSNDFSMPEEINRIVTDSLTDYFFTTSEYANDNLLKSGVPKSKIFFVGNTMVDTLIKYKQHFKKSAAWDRIGLKKKNYIVLTLHRPANVDKPKVLREILDKIIEHSKGKKIVFPVHPRTAKVLKNIKMSSKNLYLIDPLGYFEFNYLVANSFAVITDSGGITEEATVLNIPCFTVRDNTERPETIKLGTNILIGADLKNITPSFKKLFSGHIKRKLIPPKWDGKTSKRIINYLLKL